MIPLIPPMHSDEGIFYHCSLSPTLLLGAAHPAVPLSSCSWSIKYDMLLLVNTGYTNVCQYKQAQNSPMLLQIQVVRTFSRSPRLLSPDNIHCNYKFPAPSKYFILYGFTLLSHTTEIAYSSTLLYFYDPFRGVLYHLFRFIIAFLP